MELAESLMHLIALQPTNINQFSTEDLSQCLKATVISEEIIYEHTVGFGYMNVTDVALFVKHELNYRPISWNNVQAIQQEMLRHGVTTESTLILAVRRGLITGGTHVTPLWTDASVVSHRDGLRAIFEVVAGWHRLNAVWSWTHFYETVHQQIEKDRQLAVVYADENERTSRLKDCQSRQSRLDTVTAKIHLWPVHLVDSGIHYPTLPNLST